jgi:hypothetical protein
MKAGVVCIDCRMAGREERDEDVSSVHLAEGLRD